MNPNPIPPNKDAQAARGHHALVALNIGDRATLGAGESKPKKPERKRKPTLASRIKAVLRSGLAVAEIRPDETIIPKHQGEAEPSNVTPLEAWRSKRDAR
jgi:hypothetical protein